MDRADLARNHASRSEIQSLIADLSDEALSRPLPDGWTVSAILAHLTFWDQRALFLLGRWERDQVGPSPHDVEAINEAALPQWLALPPADTRRLWLATAEGVDQKLDTLSPEMLDQVEAGAAMAPIRADHRSEHLQQIRRYLAQLR